MAELATLARPYANAAFDVARRGGDLSKWSRALAVMSAAAADQRVRGLLEAPDLAGVVKAQKLIDVCGDELDDRSKRFVQVLAANKRLDLIGEINEQFEALRAAEEQQVDVEITSAKPLSEAQLARLTKALEDKHQRTVNVSHLVDTDLIGGAVIRTGDTVIDGSVRGKLNKLAETVLRN